ncbi:MAG TPA: vanadium-dependent haloperoxidase [Longimicrobium sp.]|nr:vanadium-dependent haloperoxidase [Longimicrobium sp.]
MSRCSTQTPPDPNRRENARNKRIQAADIAYNRAHPCHQNNCEEVDYPYVGNFSKGLQHDSLGDVIPASYQSLLYALQTRNPADFEAIQLGPGGKKLTNPQAGLAFDLQGADPQSVTQPPAPRIDSAQVSSEMGELYWMALARDVHFNDYAWSTVVQEAIQSLNTEFSYYQPRSVYGTIRTQTIFRGVYPGEAVGPFLSQFLLKGNSDPGSPAGQGRYDSDGYIRYGAQKIDQRRQTVVPGVDYLTDFYWWLMVQDGADKRGMDQFDMQSRRFIRNLRDLGNYVHFDNVADAFYNACWYLLQEPVGDQQTSNARPDIDREFPNDPMNPYNGYAKQAPLVTYGDIHALRLVWETVTRALQAVWFQKWFVHRRLRPEELGGRIDNHLTGRRGYPQINGEILGSLTGGLLSQYFPSKWGSYLLPQAFPEGAPTHPAYGAGHATAAGALATILKAFFDENAPIENPVTASADGLWLIPYTGPDAGSMTVGGELNKLAGNIAIGRNAAGVHWQSDYAQSLLLGEEIAIRILQEQSILYNEGGGFMLTRFDGQCIKIWDGHVDYCSGGSIEPATTAPYGEECPTTDMLGEESTADYAGEEGSTDLYGEEVSTDAYGEESTVDYYGEENSYPYPYEPQQPSPDQQFRPAPEDY